MAKKFGGLGRRGAELAGQRRKKLVGLKMNDSQIKFYVKHLSLPPAHF